MRWILIAGVLGALFGLALTQVAWFASDVADFQGTYSVGHEHGDGADRLVLTAGEDGTGELSWTQEGGGLVLGVLTGRVREVDGVFELDVARREGTFERRDVRRLVPCSAQDVRYLVSDDAFDDFVSWLRSGRPGPAGVPQDPPHSPSNPGLAHIHVPARFAERVR